MNSASELTIDTPDGDYILMIDPSKGESFDHHGICYFRQESGKWVMFQPEMEEES